MRAVLYIVLAVLLITAVIALLKKVVKTLIGKMAVVLIAVFLFCEGGTLINLNTLSAEVQSKVSAVAEILGETVIRQEGNKVEVKLREKWYNVSDLILSGVGEDLMLTYDGVEIPVGKSGIANAIEVLDSFGLIKRN